MRASSTQCKQNWSGSQILGIWNGFGTRLEDRTLNISIRMHTQLHLISLYALLQIKHIIWQNYSLLAMLKLITEYRFSLLPGGTFSQRIKFHG